MPANPLSFLDSPDEPRGYVPPPSLQPRQKPPAIEFNPLWLIVAFVILVLANVVSWLIVEQIVKAEWRQAIQEARDSFKTSQH